MEYYSSILQYNRPEKSFSNYMVLAGMMSLSNWCSASEFHYEDEMVTPAHSHLRRGLTSNLQQASTHRQPCGSYKVDQRRRRTIEFVAFSLTNSSKLLHENDIFIITNFPKGLIINKPPSLPYEQTFVLGVTGIENEIYIHTKRQDM